MSDLRQQLDARLRQATSEEEVVTALYEWQGSREEGLQRLAAHSALWSRSLVALAATSARALELYLENPARTAEGDGWWLAWLQRGMDHGERRDEMEESFSSLQFLIESGTLEAEHEFLREMERRVRAPSRAPRIESADRAGLALSLLLAHPGLKAERVADLYDAVRHRLYEQHLAVFATHPALDSGRRLQILVEDLRGTLPGEVVERLLESEVTRRDPLCRPLIREAALRYQTEVSLLVEDADPEDCRMLFLRVLQGPRGLWMASTLLRNHGKRVAPLLEAADLRPLLESSRAEDRLAAIACSGYVRETVERSEGEPSGWVPATH